MFIKQIYTNCLSEAAYYMESDGEAAVLDPMRDVQVYIDLAKERGATIKYVFETHFHADFVSGNVELARRTGAEIVFGPLASAKYEITVAEDGQHFKLGSEFIKVLHTPGHTLESSCFLAIGANGNYQAVFTGDTLFVGDVGRPDLAVSQDLSREDLAGHLYHSINTKLLPLDDGIILYPGHGAGSLCGKAMSQETKSTIGEQKISNYALQTKSKKDFIEQVLEGLRTPPQYFPKNAQINKIGYTNLDVILKKSLTPLSIDVLIDEMERQDLLILDTRKPLEFSSGYIKGAINIGLEGSFASWVGTLIEDLNKPIVLIVDEGQEREVIIRLARVGYENVIGYLEGGIESWLMTNQEVENISNECSLNVIAYSFNNIIIDVRTEGEYNKGNVDKSINIPLSDLNDKILELDKSATYYIYCKSGYRSIIASSIMKKEGFRNVINIETGYEGILNIDESCGCVLPKSAISKK
jgi:hydroxyacylglutathione hydrolase